MEDALGPLMDIRNFVPAEKPPKSPYTPENLAESPSVALKNAAQVSGRVISVTTQLRNVVVVDGDRNLSLRRRRGRSSLQGAINCLNKSEWDCVFVGWTGEVESATGGNWDGTLTGDERKTVGKMLCDADKHHIVPVWLDFPAREYAEHTIWPICHYIHTLDVRVLEAQSEDGFAEYERMNREYAKTIIELYQPGDIIWIHDYYLMLLPDMLRQALGSEATIGLFIHTSFPSSEFLRSVPQRRALLEGMLGSTVVGFQSANYARHFVSSCIRVLGNDHQGHNILQQGRIVGVVVQHIGLDVDTVVAETETESSRKIVKEVLAMNKGLKMIIGRDKLDNAQGVIQKLHAYAMFLEYYPEWRTKVVLVQITTPSYNQEAKAEQSISELIADINGTYGTIDWWPVQHHSHYINQTEYYALMETANIGLFTSIRDSTCYAALEYIACQRQNRNPIIISEFMGIAEILQGAIKINPFNPTQVAEAIHLALEAPQRDASDFELSIKYSVGVWVQTFLSRLVKHELKHDCQHYTPNLERGLVQSVYKKADKRLLLFDYDGTLTPIVRDPAAAVPSPKLKAILEKLCGDPKNDVWIISGRDQAFLDKHLGQYHLNMSAEHGCFTKYADSSEWEDLASKMDNSWKSIVLEVMQAYAERTQGSEVEQKKQAFTWHYRRADPVFGAFQAGHLRSYLENSVAQSYPVDVMSGKANVEVRPRMFNKGEIVRSIFKEQDPAPQFVMCCGDDITDEDMFRAVNDQGDKHHYFPVSIGESSKLTVADYHVANPEQVLEILGLLVGL